MAADYDFRAEGLPWMVITVLTSGVKKVLLPNHDVTLVHLNMQNDGATPSDSEDKIFIMRDKDAAGSVVTMAENFTDGVKAPLWAGGSVTFRGQDVPVGADSGREIQIKATGHGAKVLLLKGTFGGNK